MTDVLATGRNSCSDSGRVDDSLLFFFLLLVVIFCNCEMFGGRRY